MPLKFMQTYLNQIDTKDSKNQGWFAEIMKKNGLN